MQLINLLVMSIFANSSNNDNADIITIGFVYKLHLDEIAETSKYSATRYIDVNNTVAKTYIPKYIIFEYFQTSTYLLKYPASIYKPIKDIAEYPLTRKEAPLPQKPYSV